jgi:hypothetical protein
MTMPDLSIASNVPVVLIQPGDIKMMDQFALNKYLSDISAEDQNQASELWKKYAGRKDLVSSNTPQARRKYSFDNRTMTYYQSTRSLPARPIASTSIKMDVNRFALGVQAEQRKLMADLINGAISPQQWYDSTTRLMKLSYLATVDVARGTNEPMNDEEKKYWLLLLLLLFMALNDFVTNIENGEVPINGRLPIYAGLRGGAARSVYENWRLNHALRNGFDQGRRVLGVAEHCKKSESRPGCV